jgi:hypothetical protein
MRGNPVFIGFRSIRLFMNRYNHTEPCQRCKVEKQRKCPVFAGFFSFSRSGAFAAWRRNFRPVAEASKSTGDEIAGAPAGNPRASVYSVIFRTLPGVPACFS